MRGIHQQDVSTPNINARAPNRLIQVGRTDVGLRLLVRDIDAARAFPMRFVALVALVALVTLATLVYGLLTSKT